MDGKDVNASYLTILRRKKFKPKSTGMHEYTIIFIILGLFIAGEPVHSFFVITGKLQGG